MKQTVEEVAKYARISYAQALSFLNGFQVVLDELYNIYEKAFCTGAKWQKEQPLWINAKDQLPKIGEYVLVLLKDHTIHTAYLEKGIPDDNTLFWMEYNEKDIAKLENVLAWMPIPSFDEILETNPVL